MSTRERVPGRWLAMRIGCLECRHPSEVVGTYGTPEAALEAAGPFAKLATSMKEDDWWGEGAAVVFDLLAAAQGEAAPDAGSA